MIQIARFTQACTGFLLGTMGASAPVGVAFMCVAMIFLGPHIVVGWLAGSR